MNKKWIKRLLLSLVLIPILLFVVMIALIFWKQDVVVQNLITTLNQNFTGEVEVKDSHISPFTNFPYVSIDLDEVKMYEDKNKSTPPLLTLHDVYLGFDLWTLLNGSMEIKAVKLKDGFIRLVQHTDGSFNITNALTNKKEIENTGEKFQLNLKSISLINVDILKLNEKNNILIKAFIEYAKSKFKTSADHIMASLDSRFLVDVMVDGDTTIIKHKHIDLFTQLDFSHVTQLLTIQPSELQLEKAVFKMDGTIDFDDDMNLDLKFHANKPNFDLFHAFVPEELAPVLQRYDYQGKIFFDASISGKSINGHNPMIIVDFGCEDAYFIHKLSKKKLDDLYFKGHFTTGGLGNASASEFSLTDFSAKLEAGMCSGNLLVKNFNSPEINMKLSSEFELDFLAQFLNITDLQDLKGHVALTMNFHDIVDLANPEKSIEKFNEFYFTELEVNNLSFRKSAYHLPIHDIDIKALMDGHKAVIDHLNIKVGDSDISFQGTISDLPAILHHTSNPITTNLIIKSSLLDIKQLTSMDTAKNRPVDEQIKNLSMKLKFNSSARAFTESPTLPVGELFIEDMYASLTHYPHTLHDFHADVFIDDHDFRVVDFTGMIDQSDFHFTSRLKNYDLWFNDDPLGDTKMEFNLTSTLLQLNDLFAYGGENYVPEDYRHEEFKNLIVHGFADLHFNNGLKSSDIFMDKLEAQMKIHPLRFEKFKGRVHYQDDHLVVENLSGKLGKSVFVANLNYYLGDDPDTKKRDNYFSLTAPKLDFDELFNYDPPPANQPDQSQDHEAGFNVFEVPFTDMRFKFDIKHLNYHRYQLTDFFAKVRMQQNHYLYLDTLSLAAASGKMQLTGYFNGSNPNKIYFTQTLKIEHVDLDKLLFKFENFGQDKLVSENLHGKMSGTVTGTVHMHADMVPIIDDSEIHLDLCVIQGRLKNYAALNVVSDYFKDKNLSNVRFDTLRNQLNIANGILTVPSMTINSTLGFIEISGKQDLNMNMEYYLRIPWKLITKAGMRKLFGKAKESTADDEIQYQDDSKRIRYINLKILGTPEKYKISLGKAKKRNTK